MTAVEERAARRTLNDPVEVRFTREGVPLAVRRDGRLCPVAAEPLHWTSGWNWPEILPGRAQGTAGWLRLSTGSCRCGPRPVPGCAPSRRRRHPGWEGWHLIGVCNG